MNDLFTQLMQGTMQLTTHHSGAFIATGMRLWAACAGIALALWAWSAVYSWLNPNSGGMAPIDSLLRLCGAILVSKIMLWYYIAPLPGLGMSFSNVLLETGLSLSSSLEQRQVEETSKVFAQIYSSLEQPSWISSIGEHMRYWLLLAVVWLAQTALYFIVGWGFVAVGMASLFGPIVIPFVFMPKINFMFWGWLKATIQYSFYPFFAQAFVWVYAQIIIHWFQVRPLPYDAQDIAGSAMMLICLLMVFIFGVFKVTSFVSAVFSGRAGDHTMPGFGWWRG